MMTLGGFDMREYGLKISLSQGALAFCGNDLNIPAQGFYTATNTVRFEWNWKHSLVRSISGKGGEPDFDGLRAESVPTVPDARVLHGPDLEFLRKTLLFRCPLCICVKAVTYIH
jgi:hypothetical protein